MIIVLGSEKLSLVEMEAFLLASESVGFSGASRQGIYRWAERLLCYQEYWTQKRRAKGLIRAYMARMTGLSRAQCTRWEIVAATPLISERYLLPVLEAMLRQFPFAIKGFHSGNGSEYINRTVETLLNKLLIEQTKSRARHSGDNGLVETKNAAIVRKHIGFGHIAPAHAERVNQFHRDFLNPYVNFHRPSAQPEIEIDKKGRKRRLYKQWLTPLEKLLSLDEPEQYLRHGRTLAALKRAARALSDTDAALRLQRARDAMFADIQPAA